MNISLIGFHPNTKEKRILKVERVYQDTLPEDQIHDYHFWRQMAEEALQHELKPFFVMYSFK